LTGSVRALAVCGLAALALSFAPFFRPSAIAARLDSSRDPGFAFDPAYGKFLEAVEKATPPAATIVLIAPQNNSLYASQAAYRLAPRRVVDPARSKGAQFLAVYRRGTASASPPGATALPGGFLSTP
jgi:hypothetical protein